MEQTITIPQQTVRKVTNHVNVDVDNKTVSVVTVLFNSQDIRVGEHREIFNILTLMNDEGFTNAEKLAVKKFFECVIAKAWNITKAELTATF